MSATFVLVNPASAHGKTKRRWPHLALRLRGQIGEFEVGFTEYSRHGEILVRQAISNGARHIISVGGDGTHNEVVNGFFEGDECLADDLRLSIIPMGTGGDLRRTMGLPNSALDAIDSVGKNPRKIDLGRMTYVDHQGETRLAHFINIASFGAAGLVDQIVNESSKALGGKLSFLLGATRGTLRYKNQDMRIILEPGTDKEKVISGRFFNGVVANARYFGGGMMIAPHAHMSDGLFDIILLGDLSTLEVLRGMPTIYSGKHINRPKTQTFRVRHLRAEPMTQDAVLIDLDGEQPGRLTADFTVVESAIELCFGSDTY